ncbi:MAG: TRAP transporter large permease subunit [Dehalococcoidia bacterium]|nr:TRAP transporter large permease subunit [Dehalococcoidia bacterium]
MSDLGPGMLTLLLFGSLIIVLLAGLPLAWALGGVATVFIVFVWGPQGLGVLASRAYTTMGSFILVAIPMFVFMGAMLEKSGIADDLYTMMYYWMGQLKGGLAAGTVLICTLFAAMVGISGASTVAMGLLALPAMLSRGYKKEMALGCICAGGALGILIPPSVVMIILGVFGRLSVGQLFLGGVLPGLLLAFLFVAYILIRSHFQPELGPAIPKEEMLPWSERLKLLPKLAFPLGLIFLVMGSIFFGVATPTEASAVGAGGSVVCAVLKKRLNRDNFKDALFVTMKLSSMILWIVIAASAFTSLYAVTGAQSLMTDILLAAPGGRWGAIILMQLVFFALGCFMDPTGILMITTPIFFPVVQALGFDPLWFGVLFVVNMEMAFLTPPFGLNLFFLKGVAPPDVTMSDIYRSILPFVGLQALGLVFVMVFPWLATWLPSLMITTGG